MNQSAIASILLSVILFTAFQAQAQDEVTSAVSGHRVHIEFTAGINNTTPLGIDAKAVRDDLDALEEVEGDYSGALLPKTAAYVGILAEYEFHRAAGVGLGLIYTPKGLWLFEQNIPRAIATASLDRRKTFITVDYFDMPLFVRGHLKGGKLSVRFGPVFSFALLSKVRINTTDEGVKAQEKYRLGEGIHNEIFYDGLVNEVPAFMVPGCEAGLNFGNTSGWQGSVVVGFSGSMLQSADLKSFIARIGASYTISR